MRRWLLLAGVCLGLLFFATACGGGSKSSDGGGAAPAPASTGSTASTPQTFELRATDQGSGFAFQPGTLQLKPGEITVKYANDSIRSHNLVIKSKSGTQIVKSEDYNQGQGGDVKFTISEEGTYDFLCDHTGHADRGLRSTLTVSKS